MTEEQARQDERVLAGTHRPQLRTDRPGVWRLVSLAASSRAMKKWEHSGKGQRWRGNWNANHPLRIMLYQARDEVRRLKNRLEELECAS